MLDETIYVKFVILNRRFDRCVARLTFPFEIWDLTTLTTLPFTSKPRISWPIEVSLELIDQVFCHFLKFSYRWSSPIEGEGWSSTFYGPCIRHLRNDGEFDIFFISFFLIIPFKLSRFLNKSIFLFIIFRSCQEL